MLELLGALGGIVLVDLALSGDNALVIGAAAAGLPRQQRWTAIFAGGAAAILLRIIFAFIASFLLLLPWLQAIGGLILLIIAVRLLLDRHHQSRIPDEEHAASTHIVAQEDHPHVTSRSFLSVLLTILIADVTMSLDNVLAVGALAHGNFLVLSIGILLSLVILLVGSALVAELMKRLPWLLDVAALVLAWTGATMMMHDQQLGAFLHPYTWTAIAVPVVSLSTVLVADLLLRLREKKITHLSPLQ